MFASCDLLLIKCSTKAQRSLPSASRMLHSLGKPLQATYPRAGSTVQPWNPGLGPVRLWEGSGRSQEGKLGLGLARFPL